MTTETKSQAQHTPGPWHQMNDGLHECRVIQDNSGQRIAEADFGFDDNGLANARLIAAAPDLLAACKLAIEKLELLGPAGDANRYIAWPAISEAKAEGRAE